jgi:histidine triad (HIT) family protein
MSDEKTIFEQIIAGEIPSNTIYEDETTYAFLDANPLAPGHTLVIPREPYERVNDMPPELLGDIFDVAGHLADAVERAVDADATTMAINNGEEAGQEVPHVHLHIIPQFEEDNSRPIHALFEGADLDDDEMEEIAAAIRENQ